MFKSSYALRHANSCRPPAYKSYLAGEQGRVHIIFRPLESKTGTVDVSRFEIYLDRRFE